MSQQATATRRAPAAADKPEPPKAATPPAPAAVVWVPYDEAGLGGGITPRTHWHIPALGGAKTASVAEVHAAAVGMGRETLLAALKEKVGGGPELRRFRDILGASHKAQAEVDKAAADVADLDRQRQEALQLPADEMARQLIALDQLAVEAQTRGATHTQTVAALKEPLAVARKAAEEAVRAAFHTERNKLKAELTKRRPAAHAAAIAAASPHLTEVAACNLAEQGLDSFNPAMAMSALAEGGGK